MRDSVSIFHVRCSLQWYLYSDSADEYDIQSQLQVSNEDCVFCTLAATLSFLVVSLVVVVVLEWVVE